MATPSLTVIVPTYNEQDSIGDCIGSLLDQQQSIDEIVVVDNNSSDDTVAIVRRLQDANPIIRLVTESRQGLTHARTRGFDEARGDILARIDCDARPLPGWADAVTGFFRDHGEHFAAGTGLCRCYDLPFQSRFVGYQESLTARVRSALRDRDVQSATTSRLFGSNMMLTRETWRLVRDRQSGRTDVFEDLDLSLPLHRLGLHIGIVPGADAEISGRRYLTSPVSYLRYCVQDTRTHLAHGMWLGALRSAALILVARLPFYLVMWAPFRLYEPTTRRFRARNLFRGRVTRGLP